jgi:hypothetical protein
MAEIQIDAAKAERMIAQILRDEKNLLPADANALAANICCRLSSAMATPTNQPLQAIGLSGILHRMAATSPLLLVKKSPTSMTGLPVNFGNWSTTEAEIFPRPSPIQGVIKAARKAPVRAWQSPLRGAFEPGPAFCSDVAIGHR